MADTYRDRLVTNKQEGEKVSSSGEYIISFAASNCFSRLSLSQFYSGILFHSLAVVQISELFPGCGRKSEIIFILRPLFLTGIM